MLIIGARVVAGWGLLPIVCVRRHHPASFSRVPIRMPLVFPSFCIDLSLHCGECADYQFCTELDGQELPYYPANGITDMFWDQVSESSQGGMWEP